MSAASPMGEGEKDARKWAAEQDTDPAGLITMIANMRRQQELAEPEVNALRAELNQAIAALQQILYRIEALKYRLVSEL